MPTQKTCKQCQEKFKISDFEIEFIKKISPEIGTRKFEIPLPEMCPNCRLRERNAHRNEQYMYHSESAKSQEPVISLYAPDTSWSGKYKIWTYDEWWNDSWDPMDFGMEFDFNKGFFEQFAQLDEKIPRVNLVTVSNENCDFTTGTGYCKNCYLINCSEYAEDCYYCKLVQSSKDVMDSCYIYDSELLYQCFNDTKCYGSAYLYHSNNCSECYFSENLTGCKNCLLCTNLNNKEYYYLNKSVSKEEYAVQLNDTIHKESNLKKTLETFNGLREKRIHKYANIIKSENSTGDFLTSCKGCTDCYDMNDSENCRYVTVGVEVKDNLDCSNMYVKPELCYQVLGTIEIYNIIFCIYVFHCQNVMYSQFCYHSKDLFGCVGLNQKQYCIFNKQYTKEEYEKLVPKIIEHMQKTGEWGKFFPIEISPFGYNETVAQEYLPLTKEEAQARGYNWKDKDKKEYQPQSYELPDSIDEIDKGILDKVLACESCGKNYKIIPHELMRLKQFKMPAPRLCFDCRHEARMNLRNPRILYHRQCMNEGCANEFETTYAPERPEKIYCEDCYQKAVI